jgi:hypothetical protein
MKKTYKLRWDVIGRFVDISEIVDYPSNITWGKWGIPGGIEVNVRKSVGNLIAQPICITTNISKLVRIALS